MYELKVGVPQGSCAGLVACLGYLSSLYDLPEVEGYADDNQLYLAFTPGKKMLKLMRLRTWKIVLKKLELGCLLTNLK